MAKTLIRLELSTDQLPELLSRFVPAVLVTLVVLFAMGPDTVRAQGVPNLIAHQGRLLNAQNQPITTTASVGFTIYNAASGGAQVWTETKAITPDSLGFYETYLGDTAPLPLSLPNPAYLEVAVGGETLSPRLRLASVPFAQLSGALNCNTCSVGVGTLSVTGAATVNTSNATACDLILDDDTCLADMQNGQLSVRTANDSGWASVMAQGFNVASSRQWKEGITPLSGALDKINQLQGVSFLWRDTKKGDIGLIAEDVAKVVPQATGHGANGSDPVSVDYGRITPLLIEAVKQLRADNQSLNARVGSLEQSAVPVRTGAQAGVDYAEWALAGTLAILVVTIALVARGVGIARRK